MRFYQTVNIWEVGMSGSKKPNLREFRHNDKRMLYFTNSFVLYHTLNRNFLSLSPRERRIVNDFPARVLCEKTEHLNPFRFKNSSLDTSLLNVFWSSAEIHPKLLPCE